MDDDAYTLESLERRLAHLERRLARLEVTQLADRAATTSLAARRPPDPPPHPYVRQRRPGPSGRFQPHHGL